LKARLVCGDLEFHSRTVLMLTIASFLLSLLILRQPMLRYALPVAALLVFPAANFLCEMSRSSLGDGWPWRHSFYRWTYAGYR
jgi:hypothetical protein